jgi:hypothetical protein
MDEQKRRCPACGLTKPLSGFNRDRSQASGRSSACRPCHHSRQKAYRQRNVIKHLIAERAIPEWDAAAILDMLNKRSRTS